jgi:hypothetical protein
VASNIEATTGVITSALWYRSWRLICSVFVTRNDPSIDSVFLWSDDVIGLLSNIYFMTSARDITHEPESMLELAVLPILARRSAWRQSYLLVLAQTSPLSCKHSASATLVNPVSLHPITRPMHKCADELLPLSALQCCDFADFDLDLLAEKGSSQHFKRLMTSIFR